MMDIPMANERSDLIDLQDVQEGDLALVGAKALHLGLMAKAGLPVSRGFIVTTSAYQRSVRHPSGTIELPQYLKEQIIAAYRERGFRHVAVRSSATLEDLLQASFAGIYLSSLNVASEEELLRAVEACYRSLFAPAADSYRNGLSLERCGQARMAVIVQAMVDAEVAGVLYTLDPVTLRSEEFLINSVFGLAEPLVSGRVSGDLFRADRTGHLIDEKICDKRSMLTMRGEVSLARDRRGQRSLTPAQIAALVEYGNAIELFFGSAQDIEFAIGRDGIALLQARPITIGGESLDVKVERYRQKEIGKLRNRIAELRVSGRLAASEAVFSGSTSPNSCLPQPR
jgi:pyruvate,water dikinase